MENKLYNALGLCRRAGRCLIGDFACEKAVKGGKALLIVVDAQASQATKERYNGFCQRAQTPFLVAEGAARAVGKPDNRVIAVTDGGFARMILQAAGQEQGSALPEE